MNLGDIITVADSEKCGNREFPVLSMTMHDGLVLQTDRFKKAIASKDLSGYKVVRRNQLVVSFPIDEGVLYIQDVVDAGIVSPAYAVWDVRTDMICPKFLGMFLRCPKSIQYYKAKLRGSTARRRTIPRNDFLAMGIPDLSISDQDRICAILEKIGSVIAASTKQIDILEELVKSRFVEMFEVERYPMVAVGDVFAVKGPKRIHKEEWKNDGVPFYRVSNLSDLLEGRETTSDTYISRQRFEALLSEGQVPTTGDVLVTARGTLGRCYVVKPNDEFYFQDGMITWLSDRSDRITLPYFLQAVQSQAFKRQYEGKSSGTTVAYMTIGQLAKYKLPLPPLALQREFAAFVAKVDKLAFAARRRRDLAQQMYRAKTQEFFG